jgi:hypothetical protein
MIPSSYLLPWAVYVAAGVAFCAFWWRATSGIGQDPGRRLLRGLAIVLIFTPWFAGDSPEHFAPALLVLVFELLIVDTSLGARAALALGTAMAFMLIGLAVTWWLLRHRRRGGR